MPRGRLSVTSRPAHRGSDNIKHMTTETFEVVDALRKLKQSNLRTDARRLVDSLLELHQKGDGLTRSDVLCIQDLLAVYRPASVEMTEDLN